MKKHVTFALALLTGMSFAQPYNNTYNVNGNGDRLTPAFDIVNAQEESITVSNGTDGTSNYFVLTKLDVGGTPIYNIINRAINDPTEGFTNVEALQETRDKGVIVGGYWYKDHSDIVEQPFLAKFDYNGGLVWLRIYYVNQKPIVRADINKVSLCPVYDEEKEAYFFVVSGDSDYDPGVEVTTNVIKVDGSGNLIFSYKYYNTSPDKFIDPREYPGDIEYSTRSRMYMITGFREHIDANTGAQEYLMYYFGIRNDGSLYNNYTTLASRSIPLDQDMVYDERRDAFATVFTHERNGYVGNVRSLIGFIVMDPNLVYSDPGYLWHADGYTHNGRSISHRREGGYALGSGTYDNASVFVNNPALQFVNTSGQPISAYMRYNVRDDVYFGHHAWNPNRDEYVLISEQATDLRTISTDPGGDACGMRKYEPIYKPYDPKQRFHKYYYKEQYKVIEYKLKQKKLDPEYRKCEGEGDHYRTVGITKIENSNGEVLLYPSVMSRNNAEFTIENNSGADMNVEIRSITGQLIQAGQLIGSGKTTVKLNQDLSAGIYMIHFYNSNGKISATEKILISE